MRHLIVLLLLLSALAFPAPLHAASVTVDDLGDQLVDGARFNAPNGFWDLQTTIYRNGVPVGGGAATVFVSSMQVYTVPVAGAPFVLNSGDQLSSVISVRPSCGNFSFGIGPAYNQFVLQYETNRDGGGTRLTTTMNGLPTTLYFRYPYALSQSPPSPTYVGSIWLSSGGTIPCGPFVSYPAWTYVQP